MLEGLYVTALPIEQVLKLSWIWSLPYSKGHYMLPVLLDRKDMLPSWKWGCLEKDIYKGKSRY